MRYPTSVSHGSSSNNTKTLPNRPVTGRQRSISDLLSSDVDSNTPSSSFPPSSSPATPYNPYSSDRSISIPPPTPPPIVPQQPVDPVNRAISLPPGASSPAIVRNTILPPPAPGKHHGGAGVRPGLPPPHPVHQLVMAQQQQQQRQDDSMTNGEYNKPLPPPPPQFQNTPLSPVASAVPAPSRTTQAPVAPAVPQPSRPPPVTSVAPPPPPPPPPPPGGLGLVAKFGPSGVPYAGKKPVKSSLTLAEIRAGNTNYGPPSPKAPSPTPSMIQPPVYPEAQNTNNQMFQAPISSDPQQINIQIPSIPIAKETEVKLNSNRPTINTNLIDTEVKNNSFRDSPDFGFVESLNEFEAQRNAMMSPVSNINNFPDPRLDFSTFPNIKHKDPVTAMQQLNIGQSNGHNYPKQNEPALDSKGLNGFKANDQVNYANGAETANVCIKNVSEIANNNLVIDTLESKASPPRTDPELPHGNKVTPVKADEEKMTPTPMNDDIRMSRPREKSLPKQQSLQKDCEAHSATPKAFIDEKKLALTQQKSIDKDDPELLEINGGSKPQEHNRGRRDSHTSVRYRPETPRTVTPVRFCATPKLPNKGMVASSKSPEPLLKQNEPKSPIPKHSGSNKSLVESSKSPEPLQMSNDNLSSKSPTPSTPNRGFIQYPESQIPSTQHNVENEQKPIQSQQPPVRNVSDSGISVNSNVSDLDDSAGKIVAESMLKIEAQMKRILEHENKTKRNSQEILTNVSNKPEVEEMYDEPYPTVSGYSTGSEDELKFEETKNKQDIKTGSFEVMEDFEEAPEEFDLGISSYSIAHPIENVDSEEMEKTPVPEIVETDEPPKFPYEETPYTVSTPSGTLKHDKKPRKEQLGKPSPPKHYQQNNHQSSPQQQQNNFHSHQQFPAQNGAANRMGNIHSQHSNFFDPSFNMGNMMGGLGMPPFNPMFEDQFPAFPNMFESPFQQQQQPNMFNNNYNHPPPQQQQPQQQQRTSGGERIIPIQVMKSTPSNNVSTNLPQQNVSCLFF